MTTRLPHAALFRRQTPAEPGVVRLFSRLPPGWWLTTRSDSTSLQSFADGRVLRPPVRRPRPTGATRWCSSVTSTMTSRLRRGLRIWNRRLASFSARRIENRYPGDPPLYREKERSGSPTDRRRLRQSAVTLRAFTDVARTPRRTTSVNSDAVGAAELDHGVVRDRRTP